MGEKVLVTGGGGFLGSALVRMLLARGDQVLVLGRRDYPALAELGAKTRQLDLRDAPAVEDACRNLDVIHHVAALPGVWGPRREFESINIEGSRNVLDACVRNGIPRLVYTSSPSVVHHGGHIRGLSEADLPYPRHWPAVYPETKAIAERMILAANGKNLPDGRSLRTVSLRPHLIWGPGDPNLVPRILQRARSGRLRIVGDGQNRVDTVYVDNAALAQINAADSLRDHPDRCAGKAYFITQGEPVLLWEFVNRILAAAELPPLRRRLPWRLAWLAGALLEGFHSLFRPSVEPLMTRFVAEELSHDHWFDISAARRELGYEPAVSIDEGMERLRVWLNEANC